MFFLLEIAHLVHRLENVLVLKFYFLVIQLIKTAQSCYYLHPASGLQEWATDPQNESAVFPKCSNSIQRVHECSSTGRQTTEITGIIFKRIEEIVYIYVYNV